MFSGGMEADARGVEHSLGIRRSHLRKQEPYIPP